MAKRRGTFCLGMVFALSFPLGFAPLHAGEPAWKVLVTNGQLVNLRGYDSTILIEMRYATERNCVGVPVYPADFPCLVRPEMAVRLRMAQRMLDGWGYRLKIWDAYRPPEVQRILYQRWAGKGFVADPDEGSGSLHAWGLAVDATMVDLLGREVLMPSGFDEFTPQASAVYQGADKKAAFHLHLLQGAMGAAGFVGLRNEWWHFAVKDWAAHQPLQTPGVSKPAKDKPADAPDLAVAPQQTGSNLSADVPTMPRMKSRR